MFDYLPLLGCEIVVKGFFDFVLWSVELSVDYKICVLYQKNAMKQGFNALVIWLGLNALLERE
jgi:hypothetical protein